MINIITLILSLLIVIVILLIKKDKIISILKKKNNTSLTKEAQSKDIPRSLLISLSKYERILYKKGFTNRVIIQTKESHKEDSRTYYKFYYYNLIEGIHAFIMYNPYSRYRKFYYYFMTKFKSKKSAISANHEMYSSTKLPNSVYFFKHSNNIEIGRLYEIHKKERFLNNEIIHKERLHINTLLAIEKKRKKRKKSIIKKTKKSNQKRVNLSSAIELPNSVKIPKINKKIYAILGAIVAVVVVLIVGFNLPKPTHKQENSSKNLIITALDTKKEIMQFNLAIKEYSGLVSKDSQSDKEGLDKFIDKLYLIYKDLGIKVKPIKSQNIENYFKKIDKYLKNSKIKREVAKPYKYSIKFKRCKSLNKLKKVLKWHNGIENILPNMDLLSYNKIKEQIDNNSSYIFIIANRDLTKGIALNCNKEGLFKVTSIENNKWEKEYYNIKHFFKVIARAYDTQAIYDKNKKVNFNLKKYIDIYVNSLSARDKKRYKILVNYLKQRAKLYKDRGNKELRVKVIKEIKKLNNPNLQKSLELFLNDKNPEVRKELMI